MYTLKAIQRQINKLFPPLTPQLSLGFPLENLSPEHQGDALSESIWFAVPKSKISKSKKRMKTTLQKRIRSKNHIIIDKRTGELTLKHKLPYNWKNYLPENSEYAP